jgi:hypothetical protein
VHIEIRKVDMASEIRQILNLIAASRLRNICEQRGLPTGGDQDEKRERLARSFRGNVVELLPHLNRAEMADVLDDYMFHDAEHPSFRGRLTGLTRASRAELEELMIMIFRDGWGPTRAHPHPLGGRSAIRFAADNDDDVGSAGKNDNEGEAFQSEERDVTAEAGDDDAALDADFLRWLDEHLGRRERMNLHVRTLVNRLGRFRADQRLRTRAVHDLARVLSAGGFSTDPDLRSMERSPGIDSRVTVVRPGARSANPGHLTWAPVPPPPIGYAPKGSDVHPPAPMPSGVTTGFERAALKLQFLVLVAAAVRRPDETERRLAVDLAARGLQLNAADHVRLRALAHQYASGHGDLNHVVPRLRANLGDLERTDLLEHIRALAPATAELDELVAVYATDLGVSAAPPPPLPPPSAAAMAPPQPPPEAIAGSTHDQPVAGGIRTNSALDELFAMEPRS